jgi:hypothetical protein
VTLSFELLETLVALIRAEGEVASAMKGLGINQPAFSKRLKYLQHPGPLLDRPWVERRGKSWALTEEGRRVWPAVLELVERYENLWAFLRGEGQSLTSPPSGLPVARRWRPGTYVAFPIEEGLNRRHQPAGGHISQGRHITAVELTASRRFRLRGLTSGSEATRLSLAPFPPPTEVL